MSEDLFETCWFRGDDGSTVVLRCRGVPDSWWQWYDGNNPTDVSADERPAALDLAVAEWGQREGFGASWW